MRKPSRELKTPYINDGGCGSSTDRYLPEVVKKKNGLHHLWVSHPIGSDADIAKYDFALNTAKRDRRPAKQKQLA